MTVLVTWGSWYVWSHMAKKLKDKWVDYKIITRSKHNVQRFWDDFVNKVEEVDLLDKTEISRVFEKYNIEAVFHLASLTSPRESIPNSEDYIKKNNLMLINLLEVMKFNKVWDIIFASTWLVYSAKNSFPLKENMRLESNNPYALSKILWENILEGYCRMFDFRWVSARIFNPVWYHLNLQKDEEIPLNSLFDILVNVVLWNQNKLIINGIEFDTPDGTCIRDYIDIDDLTECLYLWYKYLKFQDLGSYDSFNMWSWYWISILELIKIFEEVSWKKINYEVWRWSNWDVSRLESDISKSSKKLWYYPKHKIKDSVRYMLYNH